ncbi:orotidine-5'-phosphate decarboxylase [Acetobacter sp. AN02]|uniref:orotidine-5'-phosphate decarboxylase n=1 Tax=Acetobacter sp. AN02 TaxID=2894186 RepID=UPI0024345942|nr:orotidine-5'-phosphate decarboxylase [Acetobacter sp. AN02]MDG6094182.1 orotidine-5'-phosphate decarboxylase [Acetobacter sp. AN02]
MRKTQIIVALDTQNPAQAREWIAQVRPFAGAVKLGLEFTYAAGPAAVAEIARDTPVFLDLKLHDIPNTVAGALHALAPVQPMMLTIHAAGGAGMISAARQAINEVWPEVKRPLLLAVTVLTSLDDSALAETGITDGAQAQVIRLAGLALAAGADGLVCSPHELAVLRKTFGDGPVLVTPGIRPAGAAVGDQKRVMTPAQARDAGADWIVVGRPVTGAADPAQAAAAIAGELTR